MQYEGVVTCLYRHSRLSRYIYSPPPYRRDLVDLIRRIFHSFIYLSFHIIHTDVEPVIKGNLVLVVVKLRNMWQIFLPMYFLKNHITLASPTRCIFRGIFIELYPLSSLMTGALFGIITAFTSG